MKIVTLVFCHFFCQQGVITNKDNEIRYTLQCPSVVDSTCFFDVELPENSYKFISRDGKDTTDFTTYNNRLLILHTTGGFYKTE